MRLNSKILLLLLVSFSFMNMFPENDANINYTQVFFRWNQIPGVEQYMLYITDLNNNEEIMINSLINSILITELLNWNSNYNWYICGIMHDNEQICSETYSLNINPLPDYFPNNIMVHDHNQELMHDGLTMMDIESLKFSTALNNNGDPIWFVSRDNFEDRFTYTDFLDNGNIIGFGAGKGYEIDLDGRILFETNNENNIHHDFNKTDHGTYFFISATIENHYCPDECNPLLPDEIPWQGDIFKEIDKYGNELWSWNTFENINLSEYNPYYVEIYTGSFSMDWTHSNTVFYDDNSSSVFVSIRNLSRISKINYESKELIWNMGESNFMNSTYFNENHNFSQQHSVKVLENGNILFFDNHRYLTPELSRCIEIEYNELDFTSEIVWEFVLPSDLFTGSRGDCNRLKNGNTLITAGRTGNIVEVTPNNEVVWHIEVSNLNSEVNHTMYRSNRFTNLYPIAFSIQIDQLHANTNNNHVIPINEQININIHNSGWSEETYIYELKNISGHEILNNNFIMEPFLDYIFNIGVSNIPSGIYSLNIYPENNLNKKQIFEFYLDNTIILGDLNQDNNLNILDIVLLANIALEEENYEVNGDINQDNLINILDIVILVNIILDN